MAEPGDVTVASFPPYADLAQSSGWGGATHARVTATLGGAAVARLPDGPRYTEGAVLGVGGMGKVVLAHDARVGREVALKQLHAGRELSPEERARFLREARVQGQLEHPSIVPVYDIDHRPDGATFFTMRRVLGRTLHAILEDLRAGDPAAVARFTQRELLTAFATVCLTLDYAHSRGVVHRDLKPANIMLGDFGEVYVLDWGLARLLDDAADSKIEDAAGRLSMTGEMMGTPLYMAPEQMADPAVGPAADVFALGAILFEILTLERLRDARSLYAPVDARISVRAPDRPLAPELETACVRATDGDPAARYPTARALHDAVVRYLEGDRELARRRQLAAEHGRAAREALARADQPGADREAELRAAIVELRRAVTLDPGDAELAVTLGQIVATPPPATPPEVERALVDGEQRMVHTGARYSLYASLMWFVFLPLVLAMGIVPGHGYQAALVLGPAAAAGALAYYASLRPSISNALQLAVIACTLLGAASTSRMYGPFVLLPTLVATFTIVLQAHPQRLMRRATALMGGVTLVAAVALEGTGVIAPSYAFTGDRIEILPQLHALPRGLSYVTLTAASLAMLVVPGLFIGRLRAELSKAQHQILLDAWQIRRLGAQLIEVRGHR